MNYCHHCGQPSLAPQPSTPLNAVIASVQQELEQMLISSLEKQTSSYVSPSTINEFGILEKPEEGKPSRELYELTEAKYLAHYLVALAWRTRRLFQQIQFLPVEQQLVQLKGFLLEIGLGNSVAEEIYRFVQQQEPYAPIS